jgi:hypothetical protein
VGQLGQRFTRQAFGFIVGSCVPFNQAYEPSATTSESREWPTRKARPRIGSGFGAPRILLSAQTNRGPDLLQIRILLTVPTSVMRQRGSVQFDPRHGVRRRSFIASARRLEASPHTREVTAHRHDVHNFVCEFLAGYPVPLQALGLFVRCSDGLDVVGVAVAHSSATCLASLSRTDLVLAGTCAADALVASAMKTAIPVTIFDIAFIIVACSGSFASYEEAYLRVYAGAELDLRLGLTVAGPARTYAGPRSTQPASVAESTHHETSPTEPARRRVSDLDRCCQSLCCIRSSW